MIKAIVAMDECNGIGKNGTLPFHSKTDFKIFRLKTMGCSIVMGSKTWLDPAFNGPLPGRDNYVLTSQPKEMFSGATVLRSISELDLNSDFWVIGGGTVYKQFEDYIDTFHVTQFDGNYSCDTFYNLPPTFGLESSARLDEKCTLKIYKKIKPVYVNVNLELSSNII